jgi:hypothetical protein
MYFNYIYKNMKKIELELYFTVTLVVNNITNIM